MYSDPLLDFAGKTALITGAASGLGQQLARDLAARGARLVLGDINNGGLAALADELDDTGAQCKTQVCDVSSAADCQALVELARTEFGNLDIAVNNAGIAPPMMALEDTDEAELDRQYNVNLKGVMFGMRYQLPVMKAQQSGVVLNVSSMAGIGAAPNIASYAAAKHAVVGLTRTAAIECASQGVRVNAICPFFTLTPMVAEIQAPGASREEFQALLASGSPMKRLAQTEEVVAAMLMLLSPKLSYVTGLALPVDGGRSAY
ncbi:SDR family NAD(P)-dependent oxidoreductase [Microbulbifer sp. TYP-18]|uniref:SDR family NAD(P)-dependent oxidoreductase n=1 Tax=Microbulbifer sp. TYP-18 TaxID=3230024 RepID=UPI0034C6A54D